jgi:hypothetical protein
LRKENLQLKRESSYKDLLQKRQEYHSEVLSLEQMFLAVEKKQKEQAEQIKNQLLSHHAEKEALLQEIGDLKRGMTLKIRASHR